MAIDIIARGLASSLVDSNGKIATDKMPVLQGTSELSGFTSIGKLTDPSLIEGKTAEEILLMMLYGIVSPTLTNPSFNILLSEENAQPIIGRQTALKGTLTFDRGKIEPAYGTSGYRAGLPISYTINGETIESNVTSYDFSLDVIPTSDIVTLSCSVNYATGEQPVNSIGQPFDSALPAGTLSSSVKLTAVYPLYTASGAEQDFEWFKDDDGHGYLSTFAAEIDGVRQSFAVSNQATVIGVKGYNVLTQQWEWLGSQTAAVSLTYFDTTIISGDSLGEKTDYIVYTYNATPIDERELRIYID